MFVKIDNRSKSGHGPIKIMYPGLTLSRQDTGLATLGRIDQAAVPPGVLIAMHPHVNDEILSYFRSGIVKHTDSVGFTEFITPQRLMLMKAGKSFLHEEKILDDSALVEGLQIFIRPGEKDLLPEVQFYELSEMHSQNDWRLLAAPTPTAPLQLRSQTWIYDRQVTQQQVFDLPVLPAPNLTCLLYVFQGELAINDTYTLSKGESLVIKDEEPLVIHGQGAELVLFVTDEQSAYYDGGMYSGNQYN